MDETTLKPCPFPHEVKRGVFLEIDTEDFGFARGACSDCGCAGPYVTLDSCARVTEAERAEATRLWNTRPTDPGEDKVEAVAKMLFGALEDLADAVRSADSRLQPKLTEALAEADYALIQAKRAAIAAMGHTPPSGEDG
jgi:hypothetical protein